MIQKLQNAHPADDLKSVYNRLEKVSKKIKGAFSRETLLKAMGFSPKSGTGRNIASSLVHFGLLKRVEGGYVISKSARELLSSPYGSDDWKEKALKVATKPELYAYIFNKHRTNLYLPPELARELIQQYGDRRVNEKNVGRIIRAYVASIAFAEAASFKEVKAFEIYQTSPQVEEKSAIDLGGQSVLILNKYLLEAYRKTLQDEFMQAQTRLGVSDKY